jgi:hypothetical protein
MFRSLIRRGPHRLIGLTTLAAVGSVVAIGLSALPAAAAGETQFVDLQTNLCLDSNFSNPAYPATGAVYTDGCNGGRYQQWIFQAGPSGHEIINVETGFCLDSNYSNPAYPAVGAVYTDPCNGGKYQQWGMDIASDGYLQLVDLQTNFCLDSNYSNPAYPATGAVYTDGCNGGRYQNWIG